MNDVLPDWLAFWQRPFPSANTLLIKDEKPVLIDSGSGLDAAATIQWLDAAMLPPEQLWLLINTHYHSDHVGGNWYCQLSAMMSLFSSQSGEEIRFFRQFSPIL